MLILAAQFLPDVFARSDQNEGNGFTIVPRDEVAFGRTYSEWNAAWEQWADSIATVNHPLFDNGDCSVGQSGPVWFLGGKFIENGGTGSYTGVNRNCRVPFGKGLYVAVFNSEYSALESPSTPQIADLRILCDQGMNATTSVAMQVDGQSISNLKDRFRVQSPAFGFTLPADNFFTAVGEGPFDAGTYFPGVDDGFYVMVAGLSLGHHTIHFQGTSGSFVLDITYHIYVYR
jgi:hypothetical protein